MTSVGITSTLLTGSGVSGAESQLVALLYPELRAIAQRLMRRERGHHTLQPTALVNEAYIRLMRERNKDCESRTLFMSIASRLMREILVDHARKRLRKKRGEGALHIPLLEDSPFAKESAPIDLVDLDECLSRLAAIDIRQTQVLELRLFAGLTVDEVAQQLSVSPRTVKREWSMAKAWLYRELRSSNASGRDQMGKAQAAV